MIHHSNTVMMMMIVVTWVLLLCLGSTIAFSHQSRPIQIRKLDHESKTADLEAAIGFLFDITSTAKENPVTRQQFADEGVTLRTMFSDLRTGESAMWICSLPSAEDDDSCDGIDINIGYAKADSRERYISALFVHDDYEGLGAGRLLLKEAEDWLWRPHIDGVMNEEGGDPIWVITSNYPAFRAFGFYKHMGYTPIGTLQEVAATDDTITMGQIMTFGKKRSGASVHIEEDMQVFRTLTLRSKVVDDYYAIMNLLRKGSYSPKAMEKYRLQRSRASRESFRKRRGS